MNHIRMTQLLNGAMLLALVACQAATPAPPPATALPAPTSAPPTALSTPAPSMTTYKPKSFGLPFRVSFDSNQWQVTDNYPDLLTLELDQGGQKAGELSFNLVTKAEFADPNGPGTIPWPEDFVATLQSNPHLKVGQPTPVTVGGVKGVQIDALSTAIDKKQELIKLRETSWLYLDYTEQWRFIMLDSINGERLLIGVVSSVEGFAQATQLAQKILGDVVFENGPTEAQGPTTFTSSDYKLPLHLTFNSNWRVAENYTDLITLNSKTNDWSLAFNLVNEAQVVDPVTGTHIAFPPDFPAWIKQNRYFKVEEPTKVKVGGVEGLQIDATPSVSERVPFLYLNKTRWNLVPSPEKWRFIWVDNLKGQQLLIFLIAPANQFEQATQQAQAVLDTVAWGAPDTTAQGLTTFTSSNYVLPLSLRFNSDWHVIDNYSDLFTLEHKDTQWNLAFNLVDEATFVEPSTGLRISPPQDFAAWIKQNRLFKVEQPTKVHVGGIEGVQIDTTTAAKDLRPFLYLSGTRWNLVPSPEKWRFIWLDNVKGHRLLIFLLSAPDQFEQAAQQAQAVLDTVSFAP